MPLVHAAAPCWPRGKCSPRTIQGQVETLVFLHENFPGDSGKLGGSGQDQQAASFQTPGFPIGPR